MAGETPTITEEEKTKPAISKPTERPEDKLVFASDSVLDEPREKSNIDTISGNAGETGVNIKPETEKEAWNRKMIDLNESIRAKEKIEKELSELLKIEKEKRTPQDRKNIKDLEEQMNQESNRIIEKGCIVLSKDYRKERKKIDGKIEAKLQETLKNFFETDNVEKQKAWEEKMLSYVKVLDARYDAIINDREYGLSDEQIKSLETQGQLTISKNPIHGVILDKADVAICLQAGLDINKTSNGLLGLSNKITIDGHVFDDINGLNNWIAERKKEYIAKEAGERLEERKQETRTQSVDDYVLRTEIEEIKREISEKQKTMMPEMPENQKAAIQKAETIPAEERMAQLQKLKKGISDVKKIGTALESKGKKHIKIEDGRVLSSSQMEKLRQKLLNDIIRIENELTGRDLKKEVLKVGREMARKYPKKKFSQAAWLAEEMGRIYRKQDREARKTLLQENPAKGFAETLKKPDAGIDLEQLGHDEDLKAEDAKIKEQNRLAMEAMHKKDWDSSQEQEGAWQSVLDEADEVRKEEQQKAIEESSVYKPQVEALEDQNDLNNETETPESSDEQPENIMEGPKIIDPGVESFDVPKKAASEELTSPNDQEQGFNSAIRELNLTSEELQEADGFKVGEKVRFIKSLFHNEYEITRLYKDNSSGINWATVRDPEPPNDTYDVKTEDIEAIKPAQGEQEDVSELRPEFKNPTTVDEIGKAIRQSVNSREGLIKRAWNFLRGKK